MTYDDFERAGLLEMEKIASRYRQKHQECVANAARCVNGGRAQKAHEREASLALSWLNDIQHRIRHPERQVWLIELCNGGAISWIGTEASVRGRSLGCEISRFRPVRKAVLADVNGEVALP